jgi:hypothetical protein
MVFGDAQRTLILDELKANLVNLVNVGSGGTVYVVPVTMVVFVVIGGEK